MNTDPKPQQRFTLGQAITPAELSAVSIRMRGSGIGRGEDPRRVFQFLIRSNEVRFEFEVNRCRGFALDADDVRNGEVI